MGSCVHIREGGSDVVFVGHATIITWPILIA